MPESRQPFGLVDPFSNLSARTVSSGFITGTAQAVKFALSLGSAAALGRLLTPRDFGLVGMVTTLTGFLAMFSEAGLSTATIQAEGITHEQTSNLFWINVLLGTAMGLVAAALAPAIAWFYHEPRLMPVTLVLALAFPVTGLALQHRALLNRQMRFGALAKIEVGSIFLGITVACSMALTGFGYWSLVGMQLAAAASACGLAWAESRWRPGRPGRKRGIRSMVRFGLDLTAASFAQRLARSCDVLLLGRFWGSASVGLYSRAVALLMSPLEQVLSPIGAVMLPVLSQLHTHPERYRRAFLRTYNAIALVSFPMVALFLAIAQPVVLLLLGPQWQGAVSLFAGFTFAALYMPLAVSAMWLFTSQGRGRDMLKLTTLLSVLTAISFLAGLPYGALGMVLCFSISGLLIRLPLLYYMAGRQGPVRTVDLWKAFLSHLPLWGAVYGTATLTQILTRRVNPLEQVVLCGFAAMLGGGATIYILEDERRTFLYVLGAVRTALLGAPSGHTESRADEHPFSLFNRARLWFTYQNHQGKYLQIRRVWRWLRNVYDYHPRERFVNWLVVQIHEVLGAWQPIELPSSVVHTRFHIHLERCRQGRQVVKLPHGRTEFSCSLIHALKTPDAYRRYEQTLRGIKSDPWIANHSVQVTAVQPHGGYTSEYVEGINLAQLREELTNSPTLPKDMGHELAQAVQKLLANLKKHYQEHGKLIGDWPLHNLVFSRERKTIVNVDAEGFFTYDETSGEAHLPFIEATLLNLIDLVKLMNSSSAEDAQILNIFRALDEVRRSGQQYSGAGSVVGYHSLELNGRKFRGQRDCQERLAQVPFDFKGKVVADLGCNVGGMLHSLAPVIKKGYGFDVNPNCINAAQLIKNLNHSSNLEFFSFNFDAQPFTLLKCFLQGEKVDICFLLSMCRWLKRWEQVVFEASELADALLFESNGTRKEQETQAALLQKYYAKVDLLCESSRDDFTMGDRKLYLCSGRQKRAV